MERSTIFNGKIHYKWPFSIAMLNYQRVTEHPSYPSSVQFSFSSLVDGLPMP